MPELPEVETIVRQLRPQIIDKKIVKVEILRPTQWKLTSPEKANKILTNNIFKNISRRAKFIDITLGNNFRLVIHLRMSGKLIWHGNWELIDQYTRTIFYLEDNSSLQFNDTRALGTLDIYPPDCRPECLEKLGIEPLGDNFNAETLRQLLSKTKLEIKDFLLDQRKVCGIGNIYASEILFRAHIHPKRISNSLSDQEIERLAYTIPHVLCLAIERMGTSLGDSNSNYRTIYNIEGEFQHLLQVYGREGEPCNVCGTEIKRIVQKGRSSYFCEKCQV